jgi:hypothetical protein
MLLLGCPSPKGDEGTTTSETGAATTDAEADAETSSSSTLDGASLTTTSADDDTTTTTATPDVAVPGGDDCDVWAQDCPPGTKCMPFAEDGSIVWNATKCTPLDPDPAAVGETCSVDGGPTSGIDDCELGAMCWGIDQTTNTGTCVALCTGSPAAPTCADEAAHCNVFGGGTANVCLTLCDPLAQDCPAGENCYAVDGSFTCIYDAGGPYGEYRAGCDYVNVCDEGLYCAPAVSVPDCNVGTIGCCTPFCDLADPGATEGCPGAAQGQVCVPWYADGEAPLGLEDVGSCLLP